MARKPKGTPSDAIMTLRLPTDLHVRLKTANPNGNVSEEIRLRLEGSFDGGPADLKTQQFMSAVAAAAATTSRYFGKWHQDPRSFLTLEKAMSLIIAYFKPEGEPKPPPKFTGHAWHDLMFNGDPQVDGRIVAGVALAELAERRDA